MSYKGLKATIQGRLIVDKKEFYKREDVKKSVRELLKIINQQKPNKMSKLKHGEPFGGSNAEQQNAMYNAIADLGYTFCEETPIATMTVMVIEKLNELGYKIVKSE